MNSELLGSLEQGARAVTVNARLARELRREYGGRQAARAWLVTVSSPPQMLNVQVGALSTGRVLLAGLAALVAIFGLTALLWRLL